LALGFTLKRIVIRSAVQRVECHVCNVVRQGQVEKRLIAGQINFKRMIVSFALQRVKCRSCQAVRQIKIRFADQNRRYTRQFDRYVLELSRYMTIQGVARHPGLTWGVVKDIPRRYLGRKFGKPKLKNLRKSLSMRSTWGSDIVSGGL
jgi:transposase